MPLHLYKHLTKKQKISLVDSLMSAAAVIHPLMAAPQVYEIYSAKDASGVSLWTWLAFMALGLVFLAYGWVHRLRPFILTQFLWFTIDTLIVIGVVLYK